MREGVIVKALSGFYTVQTAEGPLSCKARGRFRLDGTSPLVGDRVLCSVDETGRGRVDRLLPRRNFFVRPAVANVDALVFVAANANPVTDPFLIDRVSAIARDNDCELIVCLNKADVDQAEELWETCGFDGRIYQTAWPEYDEAKTVENTVEIAVQVNGKVRTTLSIQKDEEKTLVIEKAKEALGDKLTGNIVKEIYVPGRLVNIVAK